MSEKGDPSGVEGWLFFLVMSLGVISPLLGLWQTAQATNSISEYVDYAAHEINPILWMGWIVTTVFTMFAAFLLMRDFKKSSVLVTISLLWIAGPLAVVGLYAALPIPRWWPDNNMVLLDVAKAIPPAVIWTAYLLFSRRVRNTYGFDSIAELFGLSRSRLLGLAQRKAIFFTLAWIICVVLFVVVFDPMDAHGFEYTSDDDITRIAWAAIAPPVLFFAGRWIYLNFVHKTAD